MQEAVSEIFTKTEQNPKAVVSFRIHGFHSRNPHWLAMDTSRNLQGTFHVRVLFFLFLHPYVSP